MKLNSRTMVRRISTALITVILLPAICAAALTWETQRIELTAKPNDKQIVGLFRFSNGSESTVTITSVQPSCGCTTAQLDKHTYAPGEAGEIKAIFTLGDRVGEQEKVIFVATDDAGTRPASLVLHVKIPELLTYSPRLLMWNVGDPVGEKTTAISANSKRSVTTLALSAPIPAEVAARIESVEAGAKYELFVRPVSTAHVLNVPVAGVATFSDGTVQPFRIYVLVR